MEVHSAMETVFWQVVNCTEKHKKWNITSLLIDSIIKLLLDLLQARAKSKLATAELHCVYKAFL